MKILFLASALMTALSLTATLDQNDKKLADCYKNNLYDNDQGYCQCHHDSYGSVIGCEFIFADPLPSYDAEILKARSEEMVKKEEKEESQRKQEIEEARHKANHIGVIKRRMLPTHEQSRHEQLKWAKKHDHCLQDNHFKDNTGRCECDYDGDGRAYNCQFVHPVTYPQTNAEQLRAATKQNFPDAMTEQEYQAQIDQMKAAHFHGHRSMYP